MNDKPVAPKPGPVGAPARASAAVTDSAHKQAIDELTAAPVDHRHKLAEPALDALEAELDQL